MREPASSKVSFGGVEVCEFDSESSVDDRVIEWWTDDYKQRERLDNWDVPELTLRSDIAENFPVILESLESTEDGRERFRVLFDEDRLEEWAATRAESNDEHAEYAEWVQTRLVFALNQYSYKYRIESVGGPNSDHIVIFAMAHASAPRRIRAAIPTLSSFPVTWEQDRADHTRHLVKIHQKRVTDEGTDPIALADALFEAMTLCQDSTFEMITTIDSPYLFVVTIPTAAPPKRYVCECKHCGGTAAPTSIAPVATYAPAVPKPIAAATAPAPAVPKAVSTGPRALDVMKANRLAWEKDGLIHRIKRRAGSSADRIIAELQSCSNCTVQVTPSDREFMCIVTMLR
jgi:hypothetical protein